MFPFIRIGILGGGQLARMMIYESRKLGLTFTVLDGDDEAPARGTADRFITGSLYDPDALKSAAEKSDVLTYDIEHIDTGVLKSLEGSGHRVLPSPECLGTIQDKLKQKERLKDKGIPVPYFLPLPYPPARPAEGHEPPFPFPWVQKVRTGGYDGRGVFVVREAADLENLIPADSMAEELVDIRKELAVMVARGIDGTTAVYPVTEMVFDPAANICISVVAPAEISERVRREAEEIAVETAKALGIVGAAGIELFLDTDDRILVNEAAPRPHNSGHYTIEACATSQFEQHIRAVAGLPLGSPEFYRPAVMINLLGSGTGHGIPKIEGIEEILSMPGASLHFYGKTVCRPGRKMGHITVTGKDRAEAVSKAEILRNSVRVFA